MIENISLPLITVIVPCYNHEKYVEKCLDSIFVQTYTNIEVIVVDDCSTDNSAQVIEELNKKYDFKFIKHTENWGLTKTLNDVIFNHANGKYIQCIASDDYLNESCLELFVNDIDDSVALVYGKVQTYSIDVDGNIMLLEVLGHKTSYETLLACVGNIGIKAAGTLFRKDCFIDVGGFKIDSFIEDYDLWLKLSQKYQIKFVDDVVSYYQVNSNTQSLSKNSPAMFVSMVGLICDAYTRLDKLDYDEASKLIGTIRYHEFHFVIYSLRYYLKSNRKKALKIYFKHLFLLLKNKSKYVFIFWVYYFNINK